MDLLSQHNILIEWQFQYTPFFINITQQHKNRDSIDKLLIISYLLFVSRYFFICDDRQTELIRDSLENEIRNSTNAPGELASKFFAIVLTTLTRAEKDAVHSLLAPFNIPPIIYLEEREVKDTFGNYSFKIFTNQYGFGSFFGMSFGPDIILLPLTLAVLYDFIVAKFQGAEAIGIMHTVVLKLLHEYHHVSCKSVEGHIQLPNSILKSQNI